MSGAENFGLGFSAPGSCQKLSRVETIIPRNPLRSQTITVPLGVNTQYHYPSVKPVRRKSENCCTNCGNLAPLILTVFRNLLINKHLDLFQNGPRLANCVVPAQVHLYWCPKILSC
jgi:hypothetical protein